MQCSSRWGRWRRWPETHSPASPRANTWTKVSENGLGPGYDAGAKKIVLFGGDDLMKFVGDTSVYACTARTWSQVRLLEPKK